MIKTLLTEEESAYLQSFLPSPLKKKLVQNLVKVDQAYKLKIDEDLASDVREACGDQLVFEGFDEEYQPNEKGHMLNILMGKLFDEL